MPQSWTALATTHDLRLCQGEVHGPRGLGHERVHPPIDCSISIRMLVTTRVISRLFVNATSPAALYLSIVGGHAVALPELGLRLRRRTYGKFLGQNRHTGGAGLHPLDDAELQHLHALFHRRAGLEGGLDMASPDSSLA